MPRAPKLRLWAPRAWPPLSGLTCTPSSDIVGSFLISSHPSPGACHGREVARPPSHTKRPMKRGSRAWPTSYRCDERGPEQLGACAGRSKPPPSPDSHSRAAHLGDALSWSWRPEVKIRAPEGLGRGEGPCAALTWPVPSHSLSQGMQLRGPHPS